MERQMEEWVGSQMGGRKDGKKGIQIGQKDNMQESELELLVQCYFKMKEWMKDKKF